MYIKIKQNQFKTNKLHSKPLTVDISSMLFQGRIIKQKETVFKCKL